MSAEVEASVAPRPEEIGSEQRSERVVTEGPCHALSPVEVDGKPVPDSEGSPVKLPYSLPTRNLIASGSDALQRALRAFQLPRIYREVFLLSEMQRYTVAEIAAILGISVDTAMTRLKRARREVGRTGNSVAMERA